MKEFFQKFTEKWYVGFFWGALFTNQLGIAAGILLIYILNNDDH